MAVFLGHAAGKHPHVRGEDTRTIPASLLARETPPRAWGRPLQHPNPGASPRNTPTCVGKTEIEPDINHCNEKHPHVRGEDLVTQTSSTATLETPPRAWGRPKADSRPAFRCGNTPTCVGKTQVRAKDFMLQQKHPHVRGEDLRLLTPQVHHKETPPRAWGRLNVDTGTASVSRNTPTCVGKTKRRRCAATWGWKHPHVRGEDISAREA